MANPLYGYHEGPEQIVVFKVAAASAAIVAGDFIEMSATAGYVQQAAAGDTPIGVAVDSVASPSADGDLSVKVNISPNTIYRFPPDAGSVTIALVGLTMDVGGAQSVNIDASTQDVLTCVGVELLPFETSQPGVFAIGDVRHGSMKRVAAAVGEGSSAIRSVHDHLARTRTAH